MLYHFYSEGICLESKYFSKAFDAAFYAYTSGMNMEVRAASGQYGELLIVFDEAQIEALVAEQQKRIWSKHDKKLISVVTEEV